LDHVTPHDADAERAVLAVLAVLLLNPGGIAKVTAALEPADFGDEANRTIYGAMLRLHSAGKPVISRSWSASCVIEASTAQKMAFPQQRWSSWSGCFRWCCICRCYVTRVVVEMSHRRHALEQGV
jgi:hypothetical protein